MPEALVYGTYGVSVYVCVCVCVWEEKAVEVVCVVGQMARLKITHPWLGTMAIKTRAVFKSL